MPWSPSCRFAILALAVTLSMAGCSLADTTSSPAAAGTPASPASATSASGSSVAPNSSPAFGQPADDGAKIVDVRTIDGRTRDLTIASPSVRLAKVRLLIPPGFDADPTKRWPVLFLLHGADDVDTYRSWTRSTDVEELTASTDLLVVMPEAGGHGWYSDWWNNGDGGPPMWETFHTVEIPQLLERNWRASDRRVVAGLSMGGFGAMSYAARHRAMFRAAASFSGVLDTRQLHGPSPNVWGDWDAQADVWDPHNPYHLIPSLKGMPLYVAYGSGQPGPLDSDGTVVDDLEAELAERNDNFVVKAREFGLDITVDAYGPGTHGWPYWQRALHRALPLLLEALGEVG